MRTQIKITDLTDAQWDYLCDQIEMRYEVPDDAVRVCAQFDLESTGEIRHWEMSVRVFMNLMNRLEIAGAALTPDVEPRCDHGSPVVKQSPGMWRDGERHPVRDFADGCQSYGPYPSVLDK